MLEYDRSCTPFTIPHVETMRNALSEFPVAIAEREDDFASDSFGEISIFPSDTDVEIV
jgi:hypothetical protein